MPGNYAKQQLANTDCPNASPTGRITFQPTSASAVPTYGASTDAPRIGGSCSSGCSTNLVLESGTGDFGNGGSGTNGPSYVTFYNLRVTGDVEMAGNQGQTGTGTTGVGVVLDHISTGEFHMAGMTNVLVDHSNIGPCSIDGSGACASGQSRDWSMSGSGSSRQYSSGTIDHTLFHDYTANSSASHGECYFALDWRQFTIQNSWFYNCHISGGIRIERITNPAASDSLTIQNNWFGAMFDQIGGGQRCEDVTWGANSGALSNILIRYNTFASGGGPFGSSGVPSSSFRIIGNLVGQNPAGDTCEVGVPTDNHYGSATVDHNVWVDGDSGTNSAHVTMSTFNAMLANSTGGSSGDYDLAGSPGSTKADNYVPCTSGDAHLTYDRYGDARPQGTTCDAGADER
jgi:hypothetical protein